MKTDWTAYAVLARLERLRHARYERIRREWSVSLGPELDPLVAHARRDVLWLLDLLENDDA